MRERRQVGQLPVDRGDPGPAAMAADMLISAVSGDNFKKDGRKKWRGWQW